MKKNIMTTSLITVMAMNVTAPTVFASNSYPDTDLSFIARRPLPQRSRVKL